MPLKILHLGEIIGKAGIFCLKTKLSSIKKDKSIDFVIACGDGATGGFGVGKGHAAYLRKIGIDAVTGGDMAFFKKDMVPLFDSFYHMMRPHNYPVQAPGRGAKTFNLPDGRKVGIINLIGMHGFSRVHGSNPFILLPETIKRMQHDTPFVIVDFHSVTTAEKQSMGLFLNGKVSAYFGTGLRVLTADASILSGGTAVISDCGRTGSSQSVIGLDPGPEIDQFVHGIPTRSNESILAPQIQGCIVTLDDSGKAIEIEIIRIDVTEEFNDASGAY